MLDARLAEQVATLKRRDVDVRLDLHEGVHQLRVTMRSAAQRTSHVPAQLVDREWTDPLRDELKSIAATSWEKARRRQVIGRATRCPRSSGAPSRAR